MLAVGYTLDELTNDITGTTPASFEAGHRLRGHQDPALYFEKFPDTEPLLTTSMKSVGEAMAIGRTFAESLQKGLRSIETGLTGLNPVHIDGTENGGAAARDAVGAVLPTLGPTASWSSPRPTAWAWTPTTSTPPAATTAGSWSASRNWSRWRTRSPPTACPATRPVSGASRCRASAISAWASLRAATRER